MTGETPVKSAINFYMRDITQTSELIKNDQTNDKFRSTSDNMATEFSVNKLLVVNSYDGDNEDDDEDERI